MIGERVKEMSISTHSLTRRLTMYVLILLPNVANFNSQPHEEADGFFSHTLSLSNDISTHSLTRRLTYTDQ